MKGIAASNGIAIAKVYKLEHPVVEVSLKKIENIEEEVSRFNQAIADTIKDIETIKSKAEGKLKPEELAIFDAHLLVAQDPELTGSVVTKIQSEQVNAEYALNEVANMFVSIFESMDDAYMRERAADIKDVTYRIKAKLLNILIPDLSLINEEVIIVAHDLTPSDTAQLDRNYVKGFATEIGGRTSHSAIMARSLEIPAAVSVKDVLTTVSHNQMMILDGMTGEVILDPTAEQIATYKQKATEYEAYKKELALLKDAESVTVDGHHVELCSNIGSPKDVEGVLKNGAEGIGLYRTEFLYMEASELPSEEEQFVAYKTVLENMNGKPVVVRTLDIGGDKELPYLPFPKEMNPFLGYRAIRLCLNRTDIFKTQLRALLRASVYGKLRIMFPMIATLNEFRQAKKHVLDTKAELLAEGVAVSDDIQIGLMIEIPAAAVLASEFAKEADFFSIGTNDLIQYTMAADRMSENVTYLYQPYNPSILRLIKMTIDGAHSQGKWVGMCGEMAGEPDAIGILLGLGLDEFSMSATSVLRARSIVRKVNHAKMKEMAEKALNCGTSEEVLELVKQYVK